LVAEVNGATRWYIFLCDGSGNVASAQVVVQGFGFSYYMVTGIGLTVLGVGVTAIAFFQRPAPPMVTSRPNPPDPPRSPPTP
jgi:hypothetical protein